MNIAVIGAGVTGLAAAARLAAQGNKVTIFEKNGQIGGRMNQLKKDGFTFDMGPTIVMMPEVYKAVFEDCGKRAEDYIDMQQLRYIYDVYFDQDDRVTVPTDLAELQHMLESIEPGSTHGFMSFLTDVYQRYEIARKYFLEKTYRKPSDFYNMTSLIQGAKLKTLNHADQLIEQYIDNEKIQKLLAFQTLYIGIDPKRGPSLYSIIPMIEMMFGVHFIKGGMYGMAKGLAKLNKDLAVDIELNANIEQIIIDPKFKQADGIKVNGDIKRFDKVLCTADFPYIAEHLMPENAPIKKYPPQKIERLDYSCSAFLMYIGIDIDITNDVLLHNVIFSEDFRNNIEEIFGGRLSQDPSIYVYVPAVADPSLAPQGQTGLYILMPTPELKTGTIDWNNEELIKQVKDIIYHKVATIKALENITEHVISETIFTPNDFVTTYHAKFGAAFGLMPTLAQSNYYRPANVSRDYKDLYFAGASTHPGAGVPIVLTSAKITVDEMVKDMNSGI
ncbi:phytoene desaturase family protein [Staphylococcus simiae]|uniref:4,4'-diapophytoene desaturase (4,4'-diaponeurosporene-forming) n=1 Tax=Staphylococcus simiae CCM 7213 = CCUG 51256 TaxID=911238 RepID=G5JIW5_9STAP|nr:phytoene desaturase family protein [Staphylococcus simiae]EHJ07876.1 squalene synthase [Staphylococcus simiae CCM 7213 = CCUG 51256]PNZ11974.1 phytoene desaturase [Staphylococcus simiae]SNV82643.1 Dehydrosqualene desaturase (Diapophytoene desaturase) (4,4-diapophytoene desaturase) [Staphylococcus simiae]